VGRKKEKRGGGKRRGDTEIVDYGDEICGKGGTETCEGQRRTRKTEEQSGTKDRENVTSKNILKETFRRDFKVWGLRGAPRGVQIRLDCDNPKIEKG